MEKRHRADALGHISICLSQNPINLFANKSSWIVLLVVCSACSAGCLRGRRGHDRMLVPIPLRRGVLDTSLCDKVCQWLEAGRWFSLGTPVSPTDKTEILLKVVLSIITVIISSWRFFDCALELFRQCYMFYF